MRKALVVGIDYYKHHPALHGCVNDAVAISEPLRTHSDGRVNFDVRSLLARDAVTPVTRTDVQRAVNQLFTGECEIALFYFAGHGHIESKDGYLVASDTDSGEEGLSLAEVLIKANKSPASSKIIILDSCHSGAAGKSLSQDYAALSEGLTILTASEAAQYATEQNGSGLFTRLLVNALGGAAANLLGEITPGSVYAHIDQSLGPWDQRPLFKTNVKEFVSLRKTTPPLELVALQRIDELFPMPDFAFPLDPSYEPESGCPDPVHTRDFGVLQKYNRVNLLVPVDAPHMYDAAMTSKSCRLTALGEHYRTLRAKGRI